jgi:hypothetical protein
MVFLMLLLGGCTAALKNFQTCNTDAQCRAAFGVGATCDAGFCQSGQLAGSLPERCVVTPSDLFENPKKYSGVDVVGVMLDHTSQKAELQAVELAISETSGHDFATVVCDTQTNLDGDTEIEATRSLAQYLSESLSTSVIVGPGTSTLVLEAYSTLEGKDVVLISPTATGDSLSELGDRAKTDEEPGLFWRTVGPEWDQTLAFGRFIIMDKEYSSLLLLHELDPNDANQDPNDIYPVEDLAERISDRDVDVTMARYYAQSPVVQQDWYELLFGGDVEAVLLYSEHNASYVSFIQSLVVDESYEDIPNWVDLHFGQYGLSSDLLDAEPPGALAQDLYGFGPGLPIEPQGTIFEEWYTTFEDYSGLDPTDNPRAAYAYDAMMMAYFGLARARYFGTTSSGESVARGLREMSRGKGEPVGLTRAGFDRAIDVFKAGSELDFYGASGPLDFKLSGSIEEREALRSPVDIWEMRQFGARVIYQCVGAQCESTD